MDQSPGATENTSTPTRRTRPYPISRARVVPSNLGKKAMQCQMLRYF